MNIQHLMNELFELQKEWDRIRRSPDLISEPQWVHGALYGVKAGIGHLRRKNRASLKPTLMSLRALCDQWERKQSQLQFRAESEWRGAIHGMRSVIGVVGRHLDAPPVMRGNSSTPY